MLSAHELLHLTVTFCSLSSWLRYLVAFTLQSIERGLAFDGLGADSAPPADAPSQTCAGKRQKKNGTLGSERKGILASLLFAFLLFVVQILQVSGSHFVGVGRSEKPKPIWVQFDERQRRRSPEMLPVRRNLFTFSFPTFNSIRFLHLVFHS